MDAQSFFVQNSIHRRLALPRKLGFSHPLSWMIVGKLLCVLTLTPAWSTAMANEKEKEMVLDSVETLSRAKSKAESRVKLARSLLEDGEITTADLRTLQSSYDDARTEVNAGLDRLLVELETTDPDAALTSYNVVAERAEHKKLKTSWSLVTD